MRAKQLLFLIFFCTIFAPKVHSANPEILNSNVSASVQSGSFYSPILVSPPNNHATNSALPTFIWQRPSPLPSTTLDHYDLFIDDTVFASGVPDSLTYQDFYFYTATGSSGTFYIKPKQDISQGYHTWRVAVYDNIGQNAATNNWTFYIDSIPPFIKLNQINTSTYNWTTQNPSSIPTEASRYLTTNNNPVLKGEVETNANLQITLVCPIGYGVACSNQSWIINSTDGKWEKQFTSLIANITYTVNLSATDATGNSTIFPPFYLTYVSKSGATLTPIPSAKATSTPTPSTTITSTPTASAPTPTNTPLPTTSVTIAPPNELNALLTPTQFLAKTPPKPTLPPRQSAIVKEDSGYGFIILFFFLLLGLPTHLAMTIIGLNTPLNLLLQLLARLGYPFLQRKNSQTIPFSFIYFYDPKNLEKPIHKAVSNIQGYYFTIKNLPDNVLIVIRNINSNWKNSIIASQYLKLLCLYPISKRFLSTSENLRNNLFAYRSIPLIIAILTSSLGLFIYQSPYLAAYLYLSLQFGFSEYIYPKLVQSK